MTRYVWVVEKNGRQLLVAKGTRAGYRAARRFYDAECDKLRGRNRPRDKWKIRLCRYYDAVPPLR